ncbi:MAG: hypothetical protein BGP12_03805 [Rhodospirillales bacterium 70-18]|nr:MAG: hypothetical protein BGP12_03805 [Rhodospirillales bacterium 70-18]
MRGLNLLLSACGAIAALLAWRALLPLMPVDPEAASMAVRLGRACAALLPSGFVLAAMIAVQMAGRMWSGAIDPLGGQDTVFLRVNQRVITNTVEQMAVFVPALLALAAAVPAGQMPAVAAACGVFALARLAFWAGYLLGPLGRAPGMAASFAVVAATLMAAAWKWLH